VTRSALAAALLLLPALASADLTKGQRELALSGSGSNTRQFDAGAVSATADYGVYYNPQLELGVRQSFSWSKTEDGGSTWSGATRIYTDYHYGSAEWRPYLGASLGVNYGDDSDSNWFAGPEIGIKYYVQPAAFLFAQMEYQIFFAGTSEVLSKADEGAFFYSFGAGYNF